MDDPVTVERQNEISRWLVQMGCRYVMARGETGKSWCESVREANLQLYELNSMGASDFVMTTSHQYESLKAVFWYAKKVAKHPENNLGECVVLHIANGNCSAEYQSIYQRA